MKSSVIVLAILAATSSADVSHLSNHYLPPNHYHQPINHGSFMAMPPHLSKPFNERVETTIEKHELLELPTQIEIIKDGKPIYGIRPQAIEMPAITSNAIRSHYLPPMQEIEDLQPPQVPYEMPMRTYLPPVPNDTLTTTTSPADMPTTTTMMPPTTTDLPQIEETTTAVTEPPNTTTEQDMMIYDDDSTISTTNEMPTTEQQTTYETTTNLPTPIESVRMADNHYLPPLPAMEPQNQYLPPSPMMLPPLEAMSQPTYELYQEQMMREHQQMQQEQMYHENEMQEMMEAIAQMEQQQMIAFDGQQNLQLQPVAPVEPGHILSEDGYHYKTADTDFMKRHYRYRH